MRFFTGDFCVPCIIFYCAFYISFDMIITIRDILGESIYKYICRVYGGYIDVCVKCSRVAYCAIIPIWSNTECANIFIKPIVESKRTI